MVKKGLLFIFILLFSQQISAEEAKNYEDALALSNKTDKKVFVYFGAEWCPYCKKMEHLLAEKDVSKKLSDFVVLKLDKDLDLDLVERYNVKSIPHYMLIDKNENIIKKNVGYKNQKEFLNWLK